MRQSGDVAASPELNTRQYNSAASPAPRHRHSEKFIHAPAVQRESYAKHQQQNNAIRPQNVALLQLPLKNGQED